MEPEKSQSSHYLDYVRSPHHVQQLPLEALPALSEEVRRYIIESVASHPGHLGANLGVVELTVALLHSYTPPEDAIVWDVGHQAYPFKILTERYAAFSTNRQLGGISGFPRRAESAYDCFGTGHSSTSISAALGIALGRAQQGLIGHTVAIIGDGALTGGMAYEALNNAGSSGVNLLVILNDNNMSIDPNVGSVSEYLLDIATSWRYNHVKEKVWNILGRLNGRGKKGIRTIAQQIDHGIKGALLKESNLFEAMGFRYFGPIDGHDVQYLAQVLRDLQAIPGPKLLHCITQKGKGFAPAETDRTVWHAPGRFDPESGQRIKEATPPGAPRKYQDIFGDTLLTIMKRHPRVVGITAAMPTGSSLKTAMEVYPERIFDVGIAEGHAVTFAAGLATQGLVPFCVIYSSFLQRAYDQIIHDVALQNLHVILCIDRAGLVGEDGATHHGVFDIAYLRTIPGLTLCAPAHGGELEAMMELALLSTGLWAIRYPRGRAASDCGATSIPPVQKGKGILEASGERVAILALGHSVSYALQARTLVEKQCEWRPAVFNLRFAKPLDRELIMHVAQEYKTIYSIEDGALEGGVNEAIALELLQCGYKGRFVRLGVPDTFVEHGSVAQLTHLCRYSPQAIAQRLIEEK